MKLTLVFDLKKTEGPHADHEEIVDEIGSGLGWEIWVDDTRYEIDTIKEKQ